VFVLGEGSFDLELVLSGSRERELCTCASTCDTSPCTIISLYQLSVGLKKFFVL
jgi:hypothetical protein